MVTVKSIKYGRIELAEEMCKLIKEMDLAILPKE